MILPIAVCAHAFLPRDFEGVAHCLDRAQDAEDAKKVKTAAAAGGGVATKPKAGATTGAPAVPRRRRVAD